MKSGVMSIASSSSVSSRSNVRPVNFVGIGPARLVFVLLERLLLVLRRRRRTEVLLSRLSGARPAAAVSAAAAEAAARPWSAEAAAPAAVSTAAPATESSGSRTAVSAARSWRAAWPAIFPRARFTDGERPAHEQLAVELLDRLLRGGAFGVLDEREPARATGFTVERTDDLGWLADLSEMRPQVFFGRLIGQIAHEQSDWWHGEL